MAASTQSLILPTPSHSSILLLVVYIPSSWRVSQSFLIEQGKTCDSCKQARCVLLTVGAGAFGDRTEEGESEVMGVIGDKR